MTVVHNIKHYNKDKEQEYTKPQLEGLLKTFSRRVYKKEFRQVGEFPTLPKEEEEEEEEEELAKLRAKAKEKRRKQNREIAAKMIEQIKDKGIRFSKKESPPRIVRNQWLVEIKSKGRKKIPLRGWEVKHSDWKHQTVGPEYGPAYATAVAMSWTASENARKEREKEMREKEKWERERGERGRKRKADDAGLGQGWADVKRQRVEEKGIFGELVYCAGLNALYMA